VYKRNVISPDRRERAYHNYTNDSLNRGSTRTDPLGEETLYFYGYVLWLRDCRWRHCHLQPMRRYAWIKPGYQKGRSPNGTASLHAGTTFFYYDVLYRLVIIDRKTGCIAGPMDNGCSPTINTSTDAATRNTHDAVGSRLTLTEPDANTTTSTTTRTG